MQASSSLTGTNFCSAPIRLLRALAPIVRGGMGLTRLHARAGEAGALEAHAVQSHAHHLGWSVCLKGRLIKFVSGSRLSCTFVDRAAFGPPLTLAKALPVLCSSALLWGQWATVIGYVLTLQRQLIACAAACAGGGCCNMRVALHGHQAPLLALDRQLRYSAARHQNMQQRSSQLACAARVCGRVVIIVSWAFASHAHRKARSRAQRSQRTRALHLRPPALCQPDLQGRSGSESLP